MSTRDYLIRMSESDAHLFPSSLTQRNRILIVLVSISMTMLMAYAAWMAYRAGQSMLLVVGIILLFALLPISTYFLAPRGLSVTADYVAIMRRVAPVQIPFNEIKTAREISLGELGRLMRLTGVRGLFGWYGKWSSSTLGVVDIFATHFDHLLLIETTTSPLIVSVDDANGALHKLKRK
jgi:hypothetical protein